MDEGFTLYYLKEALLLRRPAQPEDMHIVR